MRGESGEAVERARERLAAIAARELGDRTLTPGEALDILTALAAAEERAERAERERDEALQLLRDSGGFWHASPAEFADAPLKPSERDTLDRISEALAGKQLRGAGQAEARLARAREGLNDARKFVATGGPLYNKDRRELLGMLNEALAALGEPE